MSGKSDRKNGRTTGGRFGPGNPGRPQGSRHKTTLAVEALLEGEAEALTRKAIDLAKAGDLAALKLCLDRLAPPRKGRTISFDLPVIETSNDVSVALRAVLGAVSAGDLTPDEAQSVAGLLEVKRRALETVELERRIAELEHQNEKS